jgi:hypothetical protein
MRKQPALTLPLAVVLCLSALGQTASKPHAQNQKTEPNFLSVDRVPPPYCEAHLIAIGTSNGSNSYRKLQAISEALITSQEAAENLKVASETLRDSGDLTHLFSNLFEAEQKTIDGLHCAAQIMNTYKKKKENQHDDLISTSFIMGFNQEAFAIELLRNSQKERFSRQSGTTPAQSVLDAEKLQKIQHLQNDAGSTILDASALAASTSADMSGGENVQIEYSLLTCAENGEIVEALKTTAQKTETTYGESAKMILEILEKLKCRT